MSLNKFQIEPIKYLNEKTFSVEGKKCLKKYNFINQAPNKNTYSPNISWKPNKRFYHLSILLDKIQKKQAPTTPQQHSYFTRINSLFKPKSLYKNHNNYISLSRKRQSTLNKTLKKSDIPTLKPLNIHPSSLFLKKLNTERISKNITELQL